jgi:hypothetical protein
MDPTDYDEAISYWTHETEEEDEGEALINGQ